MSSAVWRQFCLSLNVLTHCGLVTPYGVIGLSTQEQVITITWANAGL